jgi:hypothetical protein
MDIVAHIAFPIATAQLANAYQVYRGEPIMFNWKRLLIIGFCGGLPDILSPHLNLDDRYSSFAHSIWFLFLGLMITAFLSWKFRRLRGLFCFCYFAIALHLFCDLLAGGINIFAPWGRDIVGRYYIPFKHWIPLDITAILFVLAPLLFYRSSNRFKATALGGGYALALVGGVLLISTLDSEMIVLQHIPANEAPAAKVEKAKRLWNSLYENWSSGTFAPVSDSYSGAMRKAFTPKMQEHFFKQLTENYGRCKGITFVESVKGRFGYPQYHIYRFKVSFSKAAQEPEISISFDPDGKLSGLRFNRIFSKSLL